jgi:lipopolysaccharide transport system permease protein
MAIVRAAPSIGPRTVIEPYSAGGFSDLGELWRYRELLLFHSVRDVKVRYKQTALGAAWAILQPAMMMTVFTFFFNKLGKLGSGGVPYPLFALAGLLPWMFFSQAVLNASNSVVGAERLISKIYFPRLFVPLASIGAAVVDFLVGGLLLLAVMAWYGAPPSLQFGTSLLAFLGILLLASGLGVLLAGLNVTYRDFRYVVPFAIQLAMFATPTIYMAIPPEYGAKFGLLLLNPMTPLVQAFRVGLLGGDVPWLGLTFGLVVGLATFIGGAALFRRIEDGFADVI